MLSMAPLAAGSMYSAAVNQLPELQLHNVGNEGCTLITKRFARHLGLVDCDGNPTQALLPRCGVQGVVAGATEWLPQINIQYEIKGRSRLCCRPVLLYLTSYRLAF